MLAHSSQFHGFLTRIVLLRLETMGRVGRFLAPESLKLPRSDRVVCHSARGLEVGSVLDKSTALIPRRSSRPWQGAANHASRPTAVGHLRNWETRPMPVESVGWRSKDMRRRCSKSNPCSTDVRCISIPGGRFSRDPVAARSTGRTLRNAGKFQPFTMRVEEGCRPPANTGGRGGCEHDRPARSARLPANAASNPPLRRDARPTNCSHHPPS